MRLTLDSFRKRIEYSLCQQFANDEDVREFCAPAKAAGFGVACVNTVNVALTADLLKNSGIDVSCNVGLMMRKLLNPAVKIKASGGIYDLDFTLTLIKSLADQLGVSRGEELIQEFRCRFGVNIDL